MVTVDDVAGAVGARVAATANFATVLPGGIWFGRGPDTPDAYPYGVAKITAGVAEMFSGSISLQPFEVMVGAYCPVGTGTQPGTVEQFLNTALASDAGNTALQGASLRNATDVILHSIPVMPEGEYDDSQREGRDVFIAGLTVNLLCQSDGSVA